MLPGPSGTNLHLAEEVGEDGDYKVTETVLSPSLSPLSLSLSLALSLSRSLSLSPSSPLSPLSLYCGGGEGGRRLQGDGNSALFLFPSFSLPPFIPPPLHRPINSDFSELCPLSPLLSSSFHLWILQLDSFYPSLRLTI
jgi:hypothetical protein